ncbi:MAG: polyphosphate kinase 2 family protein, partial [Bacilli bacterium]|nr:polyphosphate kinase 2 family protein [Bacilli bacterium]
MGMSDYCYDGSKVFNVSKFDTSATGEFSNREEAVDEFINNLVFINKAQQKLYSERKEGVIFVFQAMDAAGKDGVIRTVFSTLSPHGVKEYCFKVPSAEEKSHDFLWRFWSALPPKGFISIFNRSYYEDVLVGKVHAFYKNDIVPDRMKRVDIIKQRYHQIKDYEHYLYSTGTRIVKIFLNVSKDEQARRFISRIDTPRKNWKVSPGDLREREYWDDYMEAFEKMINQTSTKDSPWYVVPADH